MERFMLDYEKINKLYSIAVGKVEDYFAAREDVIEGMKELGMDLKGTKDQMSHFVGMIIQYDPRKLLEAFDHYEVFINVFRGEGDHWIHFLTGSPHSFAADTRIKAEEAVYEEAFKQLNK